MANTDTEKQERQKTVVAFIAGLLIGGLLVWVFTSAPASAPVEEGVMEDDESSEVESGGIVIDGSSESEDDTVATPDETPEPTNGVVAGSNSALEVSDQSAGGQVVLGDVSYPTQQGWVVVRDYENGMSLRILGAARYDVDAGLTPDSVKLVRATEAGKTYKVVFYTEDGDNNFNTRTDFQVEGIETFFKAQ